MGWKIAGLLGVLLCLGGGIGMLAGAVITFHDAHSGTPGKVEITDCSGGATKYGGGIHCSGTWVSGGALVGGKGHVVIGNVDNAGYGDIGKTISVRLHGDRATKPDGGLPIILGVLGLLIGGAGVFFTSLWWSSLRPAQAT